MPYFTDATDDILSVAITPSFDGGQVSGISPNLIADNAASELLNMTISPNGNLQTRQGIETVSTSFSTANTVQGMFYFDTPNLETIVVGTNGSLYKYNTGSTTFSTTNGTVVNSSAQIEFAQLNNKLFVTDGASNIQFTDGTTFYRQGTSILSITVSTQGLGYTGSTAAVTIAAPGLAYGTTASAIAVVTSGTISEVIVTDAGSGYISAPSVTIAAPPSGGGHFTATATASVSALAPAGLRLVKSFTNRLFAVGTGESRNTIYASDILDPEIWKITNSIVVGGDDGEDIVAIQPYYGFQILVFKRNKIYIVDVTPTTTSSSGSSVFSIINTAAEWSIQTVSNKIGCIAGRSIALVNKDVFFLANDGIGSV